MMTSEGQPRQRLGDFEIGREVGRGGMGIVYQARQVSLNRKVALKVLGTSLGMTSRAVVRFRREAEAAAKLHHTNIVPIYATGEEDGTHFYAMEFVEGPSLNLVIRQMQIARRADPRAEPFPTKSGARADLHPVPGADATPTESLRDLDGDTTASALPAWVAQTLCPDSSSATTAGTVTDSSSSLTASNDYLDTIAKMIADVADGLDYAHNHGVIHRDMKPSNLLLSPDGRLSINDFGLARMLEQPGMTTTGEFMGSPLYMSPEQIAVGRAPLDHRTDIYSLGATLYELLTLAPPFLGKRRDQVIAQIMHKEPKPPRRVNAKIPVDLETICLKALEKDPDRRYQTAGQMAEDLRCFVNRFAISAKRAGPVTRTVKWVRRRPTVAAMIVVSLLAVGAAGFFAHRSQQQHLQRIAEQGQHALDQAVVEVLSGRYDEVEPWLEKAEVHDIDPGRIRVLRGLAAVEQGNLETALHELELAVRQLPGSLGAHALLFRTYLESGKWDKIPSQYDKLRELTPVTPEDYLYGGWALSILDPKRGEALLEELAELHPTPAVHYVIGFYRTFELMDTYDPSDIDETLAHTGAAKTQMPDNVRAVWFDTEAHLTASDIHKLRGNMVLHEYYLAQAKRGAHYLLENHGDVGDSHLANCQIAGVEGRWDDALAHLHNAIDRPRFWPGARLWLPRLLFRLGRYEEALTVLDDLPEGLKGADLYCRDRVFVVGQLYGAESAEAAYDRYVEEHGDTHAPYIPYHEIFCFLGRRADAIRLRRENPIDDSFLLDAFDIAADQYTRDELSDDALLATAVKHADRLKAHYHIGLVRLAEADRAGAVKRFAVIEATGGFFAGPRWAELLLERLREDPSWPPWIPMRESEDVPTPAAEPSEPEVKDRP
ncbi:MAG: protein kinase domain-containing protein [Planctomycetota bacterium]|jgi:serine/threonine protein kinase